MSRDTIVGFDSAWTDRPGAPGAICAQVMEDGAPVEFHAPQLVSFAQAQEFISRVRSPSGVTLLALDQPTIVRNASSLRPVERVVASIISWTGGGVQPSNTSRTGMFCSNAPLWPFLERLAAVEAPEQARTAKSGLHLIEVFPALALPSLRPEFFGRLAGPRYNPARRKTFRHSDWVKVAETTAEHLGSFGATTGAAWCRDLAERENPTKADQDRLDAVICLVVGMIWRLRPRDHSMMVGTLDEGYMVFPASADVRAFVSRTAAARCVAVA